MTLKEQIYSETLKLKSKIDLLLDRQRSLPTMNEMSWYINSRSISDLQDELKTLQEEYDEVYKQFAIRLFYQTSMGEMYRSEKKDLIKKYREQIEESRQRHITKIQSWIDKTIGGKWAVKWLSNATASIRRCDNEDEEILFSFSDGDFRLSFSAGGSFNPIRDQSRLDTLKAVVALGDPEVSREIEWIVTEFATEWTCLNGDIQDVEKAIRNPPLPKE